MSNISSSAQDTLRIHVNNCVYHQKAYHIRSLKQTLSVKEHSFHNKRSLATLKRDNARLRVLGFITSKRRRGVPLPTGMLWKTSVTHPTWAGIKYLVSRHFVSRGFYGVWKKICGLTQKKGPVEVRPEPIPRGWMEVNHPAPDKLAPT